jgi:diketogulonate reductase-like aldo/keto reductase
MLTRPIPATGEQLPVIGLGTWQTFDVGDDAARRAALKPVLRQLVESGARLVDSSPMYGTAETVVGDLAGELALTSRLFLATKVWTRGKAEGERQMEASLRKLRVERLELMQVHNLLDVRAHLDTLRGWKQDGRVRYVGVTHYTAAGAEQVAELLETEAVDFVQINYSAVERDAERRLLPLTQAKGIAVLANRPLGGEGGGLLKRLARRPLPAWAAEIDAASWAQLLLKFVISHPAITCAIPATSQVAHLQDNLRAGAGRLPDERLRAMIADAVA